MIVCMTALMSVCMTGSTHMCVCGVDRVQSLMWNREQAVFNLCNAVENIIVFAEHCKDLHRVYQFSSIFIDTPQDALAGKIYSMAAWSMALSTARGYWMLFCDEMETRPRWPFSNIWAAAAKASQEGICHQCPASVRLPANQVISPVFLAGMAQKHRLSFQHSPALQKQTNAHTQK